MKPREHHHRQVHPLHALAGWWEHWAHAPRAFDHRMHEELQVIADRRDAEGSTALPL